MRIIIADDHSIVRDGLRWMLADRPDMEIAGEASDGSQLLRLLETTDVDVVLMDIRMPGTSGLEALDELQRTGHSVRVIVLSMHDDPAYVERAIALGAAGYLLKGAGREELIRALDTVAAGGTYVQGEVSAPLVAAITSSDSEAGPSLSSRETEILSLIALGRENKQIARDLGISETTVKTHINSVFSRLGVHSRAEAVAVALRAGLID